MKKTKLLLPFLIALSAFSFYALTQQATRADVAEPAVQISTGTPDPMSGIYKIDPETFELIPLDGDRAKVAGLNTIERRDERFRATWAGQNPLDFNANNPRSSVEQDAALRATSAVANPGLGFEEIEAKKSPAEREADRIALESRTSRQLRFSSQ